MIKDIILKAGTELKKQYFSLSSCSEKERFDLVSESDLYIEKMIIDDLTRLYPGDSIYSEEAGEIGRGAEKCWIIDPIDGTADFIFGVPYFAISICCEINGEIHEAYVYNPMSDEMYWTNRQEGISYLNGKPIKVSDTSEIRDSLFAFGFSANYKNINRYYDEWGYAFDNCKKGMPLISPALTICNVARGRIDAFIDFGCSMEGQAGAALILKNAGGTLYNYNFSRYDHRNKGIIATNGKIDLKENRRDNK
ncbi:MAG: inositol monophosphatase [Ruminiclostridium sp.]|nr:inositol monophosphatase [Ruminiclostridium sp.]